MVLAHLSLQSFPHFHDNPSPDFLVSLCLSAPSPGSLHSCSFCVNALVFLWILTSILLHPTHLSDLTQTQDFHSLYADDPWFYAFIPDFSHISRLVNTIYAIFPCVLYISNSICLLWIYMYIFINAAVLSCFSRVWLCATLWTVAHQAPLFIGFSRQEYCWSGLSFLCLSHVLYQFSSVTQSCLTLCDPMDCSMLSLPVHHQQLEFTQTHVH